MNNVHDLQAYRDSKSVASMEWRGNIHIRNMKIAAARTVVISTLEQLHVNPASLTYRSGLPATHQLNEPDLRKKGIALEEIRHSVRDVLTHVIGTEPRQISFTRLPTEGMIAVHIYL